MEEKPKILDKIFTDIDNLRLDIKRKSKEEWDKFLSLIQTKEAKAKAELEALKKEYGELLSDMRYPKFNEFIQTLNKYLTDNLKSVSKNSKSIEEQSLQIARISGALETLEIIFSRDKSVKEFLTKLNE